MIKKKRKGAELIEIIIGLAIIGTLSLGVFSAIKNSTKANTTSVTTKVTSNMTSALALT